MEKQYTVVPASVPVTLDTHVLVRTEPWSTRSIKSELSVSVASVNDSKSYEAPGQDRVLRFFTARCSTCRKTAEEAGGRGLVYWTLMALCLPFKPEHVQRIRDNPDTATPGLDAGAIFFVFWCTDVPACEAAGKAVLAKMSQHLRGGGDTSERKPMAGCSFCHKMDELIGTKKCTGCSLAWYCNVDCQKADWRNHKGTCDRRDKK